MSNYFLHIGYPKCASKFLQSRLFIEQNGVVNLFHKTQLLMQHHVCWTQSSYYNHDLVSEEFESVLREINNLNMKAVGISNPGFLGGSIDIELVARRLSLLIPDPMIIIIIRNQTDIVVSKYVQYVRSGLYTSLDKCIESQIWDLQGSFMGRLNYYRVAEIYSRIFGEEYIKLLCFEELKMNPQLFINKICNSINILPVKIDPTPVHVSHSAIGLLIFRAFNFLFRYGLGSSKLDPTGAYDIGPGRALVNNCKEPQSVKVDEARRRFIYRIVNRLERVLRLKRHNMRIPDRHIPRFIDLYGPGNSLLQTEYGLDLEKYEYPLK